MDPRIATVRSFNRVVTQRVGALDEEFLARGRSLALCRVLWEIGPDGTDVRDLRARLELDSGYLSRLLRRLESDGLVAVGPDAADRRVRVARLTPAGAAERAELDRLSDGVAESLLGPLTEPQRERLVTAMATVERLLRAGQVRIEPADPCSADAQHCLSSYVAELQQRFPDGWDPTRSIPADPEDLSPPRGLLLLAYLGDRPVGCGGLKLHGRRPAEVKRMWVAPEARGLGLSRQLLERLETAAYEHGARRARLETNGSLHEAIALYRASGYREVPPFNHEPYAHHWFEKRLDGARSG
jgi:DNA-binding MarR family transcriptional regulator/GNAT superfamily N-acetyltransferase